ncbi:succinate-semialdehyde dehydrogenase [NADP+] [Microbotryum lychnidis-dioicae p1A1 Lamole]|uniref:Succinate-semialdehyde dehydrogenase n=2 Tax=Microbotryum TaxID=34416 RepID=U5H968_USTV1|nr:succinate-semialdehyde dehydrogenase [NADP+] [Microbotryum lychnidis-dioicae p1A1 Lamole]SGY66599.1 BQ5605_C004g02689 [Microbotryum silenes-dioicae]|eukprot:KDE05817.1 succinate-semialdehyde dehydrogenase [NADP+] [Microbotryum lychnidis-dioicae p1A1 Lamole]
MPSFSEYALSKVKDHSLLQDQSHINGEWVSHASTFQVTDPATGDVLGSVPEQGVQETKQAIQAAQEAFKSWKKTTAKTRHDLMLKLFKLFNENLDDLGAIIALENGKALAEAKGEVTYSASFLEWFAEEAIRSDGDIIPASTPGTRQLVFKQPVGVVGLITPWNFPSAMITRKVAPALAAGCTVVIKAPPETPFSTLAFVELAKRAGFPDGVINVVTTKASTKDVGLELTTNPIVKKISFTGSTPVGKLLMQQASSTLKKCSFELGGLAPFVVFEDADIDKAVAAAVIAKFRGSGQTCVCTQYHLVHSSVYDQFAEKLAAKVKAFKVGNAFDEGVTHGPLIHDAAVDKVDRHVQDAVKKGAKVLVGGKKAVVKGGERGSFYEPTILVDVPTSACLGEEETFGPLAALYRFDTEQEALDMCNSAEVGLAGYFFTENLSRAWRFAEALEVGMVGLNTGILSSSVVPFGGVKQSGLGREGSKYGLADYQNIKLLVMGGLDA